MANPTRPCMACHPQGIESVPTFTENRHFGPEWEVVLNRCIAMAARRKYKVGPDFHKGIRSKSVLLLVCLLFPFVFVNPGVKVPRDICHKVKEVEVRVKGRGLCHRVSKR
jgi:hypothetical protein